MTTTTADFEPIGLIWTIYSGVPIPDPMPEITVTGPVDGVWTITAPDEITKQQLDDAIASQAHSNLLTSNMFALFDKINVAIPVNRDFLAIPSPTTAENETQIQTLTRQINALLILRSGDFGDISGT
jgi:hypothetical protein